MSRISRHDQLARGLSAYCARLAICSMPKYGPSDLPDAQATLQGALLDSTPPSCAVMGFTLPPRMNNTPSAENVRGLMARKDAIEAEMEAQFSILQSNSVTMDSPLVDADGFPRDDIDVWAVRHARVRIIELRNDHKALMDRIMVALQEVYDPNTRGSEDNSTATANPGASLEPFARVDGVAPGSPAAAAVSATEHLRNEALLTSSYRDYCERTSFWHSAR